MAVVTPLVLVVWRDAFHDYEQSADHIRSHRDYVVRTVGFLVKQDKKFLSVAQERLPDGEGFRAVTHIPVSTIEGQLHYLEYPDIEQETG